MLPVLISKKNKNKHFSSHIEDVERIVGIVLSRGFIISKMDAYQAWCDYSDTFAAGWLILGSNDDQVFDNIMNHLEEQE